MVIDASAAVAWSLPSQRTFAAMKLLRESRDSFTAPWYFSVEFRNVILKAETRGLIARERGDASLADALQLVNLMPPPSAASLDEIQRLSRSEGLTHYDGHYLDLALVRRLPLATRDKALIRAGRRLGVDVRDLRD